MDEHSRSFQNFLTTANQNRLTGMDQEFTELLLKNGNVLMPNPYLKKFPVSSNEVKEDPKTLGNSTTQVMEDEMASWFPYEFLEKEFGCDFLCEIPNSQSTITAKPNKSFNPEGNTPTCSNLSHKQIRMFDKKQQYVCPDRGGIADSSHFPMPAKIDMINGKQKQIHAERGEPSSMMTVASSICGSNQVQNRVDRTTTMSNSTIGLPPQKLKEDYDTSFLSEMVHTDTYEVTGTSSSGGSGLSIRAVARKMSNQSYKRKGQYPEESGSPSEEGDYESADGKKPAQRSRRSRAAEVHNLSERRRRDRINEKMKALQDLIPHCTKSDKASMLDEAIEYLKSLQQQVQMMWMRSSMATMMFPSIQHCMAHMGMGIGRAPMPTLSNLIQIPRVSLVNQPRPSALSANQIPVCPPPMSHLKLPNQMHNSQMPESFSPYLGFQQLQPSHQAMNLYAYGPQMMQQNQMAAITSSSSLPTEGFPPDNLQNDT